MTTQNDKLAPHNDPKRPHYWLREDFDHLIGLLPGKDHEFPGDKSRSVSLIYPKTTEGAFRELRLRGFDVDGMDLWKLAAEGIVRPKGARPGITWTGEDWLEWSKEDIDAAAEWLYENGKWNSWTHFCWTGNLRYGQCVKARRVAAARYGLGFTIGFDVLGLVTVIEPPENPDDYAHVRFFPMGTKVEPQEQEVSA